MKVPKSKRCCFLFPPFFFVCLHSTMDLFTFLLRLRIFDLNRQTIIIQLNEMKKKTVMRIEDDVLNKFNAVNIW